MGFMYCKKTDRHRDREKLVIKDWKKESTDNNGLILILKLYNSTFYLRLQ